MAVCYANDCVCAGSRGAVRGQAACPQPWRPALSSAMGSECCAHAGLSVDRPACWRETRGVHLPYSPGKHGCAARVARNVSAGQSTSSAPRLGRSPASLGGKAGRYSRGKLVPSQACHKTGRQGVIGSLLQRRTAERLKRFYQKGECQHPSRLIRALRRGPPSLALGAHRSLRAASRAQACTLGMATGGSADVADVCRRQCGHTDVHLASTGASRRAVRASFLREQGPTTVKLGGAQQHV
jgi:hypothetical protein